MIHKWHSQIMPADHGTLCRSVWLPRPIRDKADNAAALAAIELLWGHEKEMTRDQADWFELVANLIADHESSTEKKAKPLPVTKRLSGLLAAHSMTAADLGRLLELEPSMGSKIVNGTRQLTTSHIRKLSRHFALPADFSWRCECTAQPPPPLQPLKKTPRRFSP